MKGARRFELRFSSDAERDTFFQNASLAGISVAELVRRRVLGNPVIAHTDEILVRELRRIGGLMKHNFSTLRSVGADAKILAQQEETLSALVSLIEVIGSAYDRKKNKK